MGQFWRLLGFVAQLAESSVSSVRLVVSNSFDKMPMEMSFLTTIIIIIRIIMTLLKCGRSFKSSK